MESLAEALADVVAGRREAPAVLFDERTVSYTELGARAAALAAGLADRGVCRGDRVVVGLPSSVELVTAVLGVLHAGAVLVPLNPAATADEATYLVGDCGARTAIVTPEHAASLTGAALPELSLICTGIEALSAVAAPVAQRDAEAPALIIYTSGTTGEPKGAVLSHRALLTNLRTVARAWHWTAADRLLLALPCFHLHGLGLGIIGSLLTGASVALRRRFVAEEVCADLERVRATMFFGVPTMYNRLVALPDSTFNRADLHRMRLWVCGSAPLTAATFERFRQRFGMDLLERYGMTECGFVLATPYDGPHRAGVVGVPLPGISVRLVDADAADRGHLVDVADGVAGEIVIRGTNLFSGYWKRPAATARAFIDGYLRSGDVALREADGMIRIVGRSSVDIIKTRGFKVSAVEIENCLQHHPQVQEVAVVGIPDPDQGERVVAAVVPRAPAALCAAQLRDFACAHLAPHKVPSEFVLVGDLPRSGPGKFKKPELVRRLRATTGG